MVDLMRAAAAPTVGTSELFQILRDGVPRTRAELAARTGLSRSTVSVRLDALREIGLVGPHDTAVSTGGRPPAQVALRPTARIAVAADIGASHGRVAVTDLTGRHLAVDEARIDIAEGPVRILGWFLDRLDGLLDQLGRHREDVVAIGIGLPGPVEFSTGRPANPPIMPGWDGFDVPGWLHQHIEAHVLVDNDVNIAALGEREHAWPEVDHMMFVKVATGIGSGIVSDGRIQRGAQGTAGDIGHVRVARAGDVPCHCGNTGCLEAIASGPAIARALRTRGHDVTTSEDILALVDRSDIDAIGAVRQGGRPRDLHLPDEPLGHHPRRLHGTGRRTPARRCPRGRLRAVDAPGDLPPRHRPVPRRLDGPPARRLRARHRLRAVPRRRRRDGRAQRGSPPRVLLTSVIRETIIP
jgi:predicted NBD/HSP70 family sugar kinase